MAAIKVSSYSHAHDASVHSEAILTGRVKLDRRHCLSNLATGVNGTDLQPHAKGAMATVAR